MRSQYNDLFGLILTTPLTPGLGGVRASHLHQGLSQIVTIVRSTQLTAPAP
jgi:hypothetical protein